MKKILFVCLGNICRSPGAEAIMKAWIKKEGKENNLVDLIAADPAFGMTKEEIEAILEPKNFVGRAPEQTEEFITEVVKPVLDANKDILGMTAEINV